MISKDVVKAELVSVEGEIRRGRKLTDKFFGLLEGFLEDLENEWDIGKRLLLIDAFKFMFLDYQELLNSHIEVEVRLLTLLKMLGYETRIMEDLLNETGELSEFESEPISYDSGQGDGETAIEIPGSSVENQETGTPDAE